MPSFLRYLLAAFLLLLLISEEIQFARAHDANDQGNVKNSPDYQDRLARIRRLAPHKFGTALEQRGIFRMRKAALKAAGMSDTEIARSLLGGPAFAFPYSASPELRSFGTVKTVTICVDFNDHRAPIEIPAITPTIVSQNLFGSGTTEAQKFVPYESLNSYYQRTSQKHVDIKGDVLGWYSFANDRQAYASTIAPPGPSHDQIQLENDNRAIFKIIVEAMRVYDATHDFAQYDNDNDGDIDLIVLQYSGPDTGWGSFWWAYRWEFFLPEASTQLFDGKRLKQFVFSFVKERGNHDYDPSTLMHEYGHSFGLADYYDYDPDTGPPGGIGGMDMMDANQGNHCAFSRWLLDWIRPDFVGGDPPTAKQLVASGLDDKPGSRAIAVYPNISASSAPSQELFLIENRFRVGNDMRMPGDGLLVWHINATPNASGNGFAYDNSYTPTKLIRLIRADNANDFQNGERATQATYFVKGCKFTPSSSPNSNNNSDTATGVSLDAISDVAEVVTSDVGIILAASSSAPSATSIGVRSFDKAARTMQAAASEAGGAVNLDEIEELDRALSYATAEDISGLWDKLSANIARGHETTQLTLMLKTLLAHWAGKDGQAAVQATLKMSPSILRSKAYALVMQSWADSHPGRAAKWYFDPGQKQLRESRDLIAGDGFAEKIFRAIELSGKGDVPTTIDELHHVSEVWGAMEGMRQAYKLQGKSSSALHQAFDKVERNAGVVNTFHEIQDAMHATEGHVGHPSQQEELKAFIREKLSQ